MKNGQRVSFSWVSPSDPSGFHYKGTGELIEDVRVDGRVLVACDPEGYDARHHVILCTATWLTEETSK